VVLSEYFGQINRDPLIVQIGANDGLTDDRLRPWILDLNARGLLIEPDREVFNQLVANYRGQPRIDFANVAISNEDGFTSLFTIKTDCAELLRPEKQHLVDIRILLSSTSKSHMLSFLGYQGDWQDVLVEQRVPKRRLSTLLEEFNVQEVNVLFVDTEGHDDEILLSIDLNTIRPEIIHFEHVHLSLERYDRLLRQLAAYEYKWTNDHRDTLAVKKHTCHEVF
jgi:FkbM family methyltransferase